MTSAIKIGQLEVYENQINSGDKIFEQFLGGEEPSMLIAEPQAGKEKIGELEVYENQINSGDKIFEQFLVGEGPPLLIAEPQAGKTGVCVYVFNRFINEYKDEISRDNPDAKFQAILICNISDNELTSQTANRLMQAGLENEVEVYHHSNLHKIPFKPNAYRLFVIDETHVALGKDRPFHNKLKEFGIDYGRPISEWEDKNNFVLSVSATPFSHLINMVEEGSFKPVVLENGEGYYSLKDMSNRLKPNSDILDKKGRPTVFFENLMEDFLSNCGQGGGHFVLRMRGYNKQIPNIEKHILENYPNVTVTVFHSKNKNLDELSSRLCTKYPKPHVNIISGSLRAGKTLSTTKFIKMWVETTKTPNADSLLQSICRNCGYEIDKDGNNRKFEDSFPIYCSMKEMDDAIKLYEDFRKISNSYSNIEGEVEIPPPLSGINNTAGKRNQTIWYVTHHYADSKDELESILKEKGELEKFTMGRVSQWNKNDAADYIYSNLRGGEHTKKRNESDKDTRIYYIDSANGNFKESFEKLKSDFPDVIGKYIAFIFKSDSKKDYGTIKENCLLSKGVE